MKNRKSVRILALLFLFAMILVQTCSGGVAISGSFYAHDYVLAQGEEISSKDIYIVVFNKVDERVSVGVEYEAPKFIEVGLSTKSCFLDPDEYERIYISLKAKEDAAPGDYKVKVIVIIKEVEGDLPTKVLTSAAQEADVTVVGEYAQSEIPWYDQEGMQIAKSQNRPAMLFFYSDRCPASAKLAEVFADTRVINMSKNFVPIVGSSGLDRQYGIRYVPTIVFTNSYGMEVHRVVGYQDADTLVNEMQYALMLSTTLDVPFFSQRDPAWRDKKLDHSPYFIGEYGCALTSAAMVAKYFGYDTDPDKLNTRLTAVGGLDTSGIIYWKKVEEVSDGKVAWIESVGATWSRIDQELSSENPVISSVNCTLSSHFIVFVGKSGDEHYFLDPYDKQSTIREWPNGAHGEYTLKNLKIYHGIPTTLVGDGSFWVAVSNPAGAYICNDSVDYTFSRNLKRGDRGNDVKYLQIVLNANPATHVAVEGPCSPCHETNYFGQLTEAAVIKYQTLHDGLTQTGEIDEATRAELNKLHLPVKHVPNGWVLNVTNTAQNEEIHDGCLWWEVEDVTDGLKGWVAYQKLSDTTKYFVFGNQEELKNRIMKLDTKKERIPVIRHAVTEHRTEFLPDNFPLGLILAMIAQEAPSDFDNEFVSYDCGRGIMQTTTNEYVGSGSGIECYSNGAECLQYTHVKDKELTIFDENENPVSYCHGSCCYDESSKKLSYCSRCNNIKNGENADDCGKTSYCEEKKDLNWRCTCRHNNNCKCKHYTNTIQGIEANIKDGLYVLRDKYNCQCCYDRSKDAEWDAEEGLYREEMGGEVIFYSRDEECKGGDGQTYDSRIEKIRIGSVQISCNEFRVIDTVWRYNGRSIYPEGSCMGNDYLRCVANRLNEIERTFGYEMPDKDTWIECLKAVSRSASVMKRIK